MAVHEESVVRHKVTVAQPARALGVTLFQAGSATPLVIAAELVGLG